VIWSGPATGLWSDPANWNTGFVPGPTNNVYIGPGVTVTYNTTGTIVNLLADGALAITGGTLTATGTVQVNNTFTLNGGTIAGATILAGSKGQGLTAMSGVLDGVTVNGDVDVTNGSL